MPALAMQSCSQLPGCMTAPLRNLPLDHRDDECLLRVATRPSCRRVHRRKAASEIPTPGSGPSSPSVPDPEPTVTNIESCRCYSLKNEKRPCTESKLLVMAVTQLCGHFENAVHQYVLGDNRWYPRNVCSPDCRLTQIDTRICPKVPPLF